MTGHKVKALKRKAEKASRQYDEEVRRGTYSKAAFNRMQKAQDAYNHAREEYEYQRSSKRRNPSTTIRGWVRAKAVKIVRNAKGQAVSVKIKT